MHFLQKALLGELRVMKDKYWLRLWRDASMQEDSGSEESASQRTA
jgi:hypothetical protein